MFNLFKKRITADQLAKDCVYAFAFILDAHKDKNIKDKWLTIEETDELKSLIDESIVNQYIVKKFQGEEFNKNYRPLDDFQLELVKMAILRAGISMKDFVDRITRIWSHQEELRKTEPKMRVSWNFPEFDEYPKEFFRVKMLFVDHFPAS
jgi:hypothetical protein